MVSVIAVSFVILFSLCITIFADGDAVFTDTKEFVSDSKASILIEASTGDVLFEKNSSEALPIGTLGKIMTSLLVEEAIEDGKLTPDTIVTTSASANAMNQAVIWLSVGEKMSVDDLMKGMIIGNANDASVALAEAVSGTEEAFVELMNTRAKELGMLNTVFANCTGLDADGQVSTAYDVAMLSKEVVNHKDLYGYMTCWMDYLRNGETEIVSTNRLIRSYDGLIGIKAGYTAESLNCISSAATRGGATYIAVVLGCQDKDNRFIEAKNLMNTGFSSYQVVKPDLPSELSEPIKISRSVEREVVPQIENYRNIVIPNGQFNNIQSKYKIDKNLEAPLEQNQKIGEISFYLDDKLLYTSDLVCSGEISKMTFTKALSILTKNLFTF